MIVGLLGPVERNCAGERNPVGPYKAATANILTHVPYLGSSHWLRPCNL